MYLVLYLKEYSEKRIAIRSAGLAAPGLVILCAHEPTVIPFSWSEIISMQEWKLELCIIIIFSSEY